ncbi:MAG: LuxR C-terminal-related transcriptional regulator, partial [Chloroflexota bacterium]|nr:LuxR C-terminal-related transcriptional regulator [Chloroflexota bacterium]
LAERALRAPRWLLGRHGAPQYFLASRLLICAERFDAADGYLRQAVAEAHATGSQLTLATASLQRSALAYRRGGIRQAQTEAALAVDLQSRHGGALAPANALAQLIDALIELGETDHAERLLEQHGREVPDAIACNDLLDSRGALRLAQGRNVDALADFREYARREHDWRARNPAFSAWRSRAAIALSALGDHDQAHELVAEELALARAYGAPRAIGIALRAHGLIERGKAQLELLAQAVSTLERSGARLEHARALIDLGAATRRQGRRTDARQRLRTGLELAHACGATALTQRGREELAAIGDRPRPTANRSDALTPRESHVAQLAADGLTNPQIAQTLYVSLKTVETHLGHVYQKLGIRSRAQLKTTLTSAA